MSYIRQSYGFNRKNPKNYSRKITKDGFICSCLCPIRLGISSINFDEAMIKYEIETNKNISRDGRKRKRILQFRRHTKN